VLSSSVEQSAQSAQSPETSQPESIPAVEVDKAQTTVQSDVTEHVREPSHVVGDFVTDDGVTKGTFLAVSALPMGRSSRSVTLLIPCIRLRQNSYREELDEIITHDHGETTTSADNTEAEASDGPEKTSEKNKRRSRLPWGNPTDPTTGESKVSSIFSFASSLGDEGKPVKKLQKKKRPKEPDADVKSPGSGFSVVRPGTVMSQGSEVSQSERGAGTLSPPPWTQHANHSQSSMNASEFSRPSHISSNRSSVDVSRSGTPVDGPPINNTASTTFDEIRQRNLMQVDDDDLPTQVVMPAAREEKQRAYSQSSDHSVASSGKSGGAKFGAWLRKKRGHSISSSTSAGGGGSAVSD
jgi:hypothetical protein